VAAIRLVAATAGLAVAAVLTLASISPAGTTAAPPGQPAESMRALRGVNFVSTCFFSHRRPDDPIVFPGRAGASHDHSFVGNTTTEASSTLRSLVAGATTCRRAGDTAAYWVPTLVRDGQPVNPEGATIYYRRRTLEPVQSFPRGLKVVAGDARATGPQNLRVTYWNCGVLGGVPPSATVPTCPNARRAGLRLHVNFPNCWDGRRLDSADHASHMAYSMRGRCPATHPVAVPAISLIFRYPVAGGPGILLASGGQYSSHADFFNAWDQGVLASLVEGCLNALRHCGRAT
jgi:uncharacterized protein DUF1996